MNHIHNIEINNFKSIRNTTIADCKRINLFIGPPNVGKSNILEGLSLFEYFEVSNYNKLNEYIRFNEYSDLIYNGNVKQITSLTLNNNYKVTLNYKSESQIELEFIKNGSNKNLNEGSTIFKLKDSKNIEFVEFIDTKAKKEIKDIDGLFKPVNKHNEQLFETFIINNKEAAYNENEISQNEIPSVRFYKFKQLLFNILYSDSHLSTPNGNNLFQILEHNKELRKLIINLFSNQGIKLLFENKVLKFYKSVDEYDTIFPISFNLIADTLQRVIFNLIAIKTNKNSVLLFEEPEAHCYEPYILDFTNAVKYDKQNNQYFMVTHSNYIVSEFLRDEEYRNQTNIYLVGLAKDGDTIVKLLDRQKADDVYRYGTNVFFNYEQLWNEN